MKAAAFAVLAAASISCRAAPGRPIHGIAIGYS